MIARFSTMTGGSAGQPCASGQRLSELLSGTLENVAADQLTVHLDSCPDCCQRLEALAGEAADWQSARRSLQTTTLGTGASVARAAVSSPSLDPPVTSSGLHEVAWVRSLLKPSPDSELGCLGTYLIRGVIGYGGMGVVLQGWDTDLARPLAIKLLAPHLASSGAARQRFLREARAAAVIVHPSVTPIYSVNADPVVPYLVMPLIAGGNLQQRIDREGALDLDTALQIGLQLAEGLAAAHAQGLIHRDIKPANLLLEEGGHRVLISDFGLARALDDLSMSVSGMIVGTPPYMSPEQARGESITPASDLFSLGSVLYTVATGRAPYRADSTLAILRQIGERRPTPLCEINEQMPAWFGRLVDGLMQSDAADRPASAAEVARLIRGCLNHRRSSGREPLPPELRSDRRRRQSVIRIATAAAAVIGLLCLAVPMMLDQRGDNDRATNAVTASPVAADTTSGDAKIETVAPRGVAATGLVPVDSPASWSSVEQEMRAIDHAMRRLEMEILADLRY